MILALAALIVFNTGFGVWSHKGLRRQIKSTEDSLVALITGKVRAEGPSTAAQQADLRRRLEVRAAERRTAAVTLNL